MDECDLAECDLVECGLAEYGIVEQLAPTSHIQYTHIHCGWTMGGGEKILYPPLKSLKTNINRYKVGWGKKGVIRHPL